MIQQISEPDLENILDTLKTKIFYELNCHRIGTIQAFDPISQTATVQFIDKQVQNAFSIQERLFDLAPVTDCPVVIVSGGGGFVNTPIQVGDECVVLFNDRDIDLWLATGGVQKPNTKRTHSWSDAIVLVGVFSAVRALQNYDATSLGLQYKNSKILIKQDGSIEIDAQSNITINSNGSKIAIKNTATDLKTILTQKIANDNAFLTALSTALQNNTGYGGFRGSFQPQINTYITQNTTINNLILQLLL